MAKLKTIVLAVTGLSAFSAAGHAATPNQAGMAMMRLNASLLDQAATNFASGSLWNNLRRDFRMVEVNPELVRRHENNFVKGNAYFNRTINRSKPYMFHIANEVKKRNMPSEIALLPFIESAYVTKARSHVGASGLWQFMPATGRHYGLEKTPLYDGRHDVSAATDAALNYLEYLHRLFGDWSLALAAYNWGEGNVGRAINRARAQGLEPTYENLRMPNETRNYVPKLLAVRNLVNNPQAFGMNLSDIDNKPYFKAVNIDKPADVATITRLANISEGEFLALNPAYSAPVFIPKNNRKLLLPVTAAATFEKNYRNASPDTLLSWDVYTPFSTTSLSSIAAETGMSVAEIKRLNGMSANSVGAGRSILVAKSRAATGSFGRHDLNFASIDTDTTPDTYRSNMPLMQPAAPSAAVLAGAQPLLPKAEPITIARTASAQAAATETRPQILAAQTRIDTVPEQALAQPIDFTRVQSTAWSDAAPAAAATIAATPEAAQITTAQADARISTDIAIKEALPLPTQTAAAEPAIDIAINQPLPLPTQPGAVIETDDPLLALAQESALRLSAADSVRSVLAQAESNEAAARIRATQQAEARAKQQQRTEARLARAAQAQPAATTHRVAAGDTLYNIAQRYNMNVADLITANNIRGSNIRQGQVLKLAEASSKRNAVRNVSYTVRKGDTLNTIASRFNVDINDIRRWNRNTRTLVPGQRLNLMGS